MTWFSHSESSTIPPTVHSALVPTNLMSGFVICLHSWGVTIVYTYTYTFLCPVHGIYFSSATHLCSSFLLPIFLSALRTQWLSLLAASFLCLKTLFTSFSITTVLLHLTSWLMRGTRTKYNGNNLESSRWRMPILFHDKATEVWVKSQGHDAIARSHPDIWTTLVTMVAVTWGVANESHSGQPLAISSSMAPSSN